MRNRCRGIFPDISNVQHRGRRPRRARDDRRRWRVQSRNRWRIISRSGQLMNLADRAKNIVLTPRTEWPLVDAEPTTVKGIYTGYVVPLALIPAVAGFIGSSLIGVSVPGLGTVRTGLG